MGEKTNIEWTDKTQNFWVACQKVSEGCKNCYMFRDMKKYGQDPTAVRRTADATFFKQPYKWEREAAEAGVSTMVFTCSWSDFFLKEADEWRADAWKVIKETPHLIYQILTKRPERIADHLPADWGAGYPNVWLGVSVENQRRAEERIPLLQNVRAAVHFLSCEPLLGEVSLSSHLNGRYGHGVRFDEWRAPIDWVIVGGESGADARPMELAWARRLRDECEFHEVAFFFKQMGGNRKIDGHWGGNLLEGQTYKQTPVIEVDAPPTQLGLF